MPENIQIICEVHIKRMVKQTVTIDTSGVFHDWSDNHVCKKTDVSSKLIFYGLLIVEKSKVQKKIFKEQYYQSNKA